MIIVVEQQVTEIQFAVMTLPVPTTDGLSQNLKYFIENNGYGLPSKRRSSPDKSLS